MDLSESLPIVAAFLLALLGVAALWAVCRRPRGPARTAITVTAGGVTLLLLAGACAMVWFDTVYTRRLPPILSPDGRQRALVSYTVGDGTGSDQAEVALRAAWSPRAHRVYAGPAHFDPGAQPPEPEVTWLDAGHLRIRFHTYVAAHPHLGTPDLGTPQGCAASAAGIAIVCEQDRVHAVR